MSMRACGISLLLILVIAGCETLRSRAGLPVPPQGDTEPRSEPAAVGVAPDAGAGSIADDCPRYIGLADGRRVCIDALIAILFADAPKDNDADGIPNLNDDDIDGDGIPNGYDLDVDGDGIPNSEDDDIDDDGVANEEDVDIDGDFLRNRWDPDMDGDLLYNARDPDADADGKLKFPTITTPACGPFDLFADPDVCRGFCDSNSSTNNGSESITPTEEASVEVGARADNDADGGSETNGNKEKKCKDKGKKLVTDTPEASGQNMPMDMMPTDDALADRDDPTVVETELFDGILDAILVDGDAILDDLREADRDATVAEVLDAAMESLDAVMDVEDPNDPAPLIGALPEVAEQALAERRMSIRRLAELPDVDLTEAVELTERFSAAARALSAALGGLVDSTLAIDAAFPGTEILDDASMAVRFVAISDDAELPAGDVPAAIGPAARATQTIGDDAVAENVWRIVVEQVDAFRNDDDSIAFSLVRVAQATERIAGLLDEPSIESVNDSLANVLAATDAFELTDPLAVVDRLESLSAADPAVSIADGIDAAEADRAAEDVRADTP